MDKTFRSLVNQLTFLLFIYFALPFGAYGAYLKTGAETLNWKNNLAAQNCDDQIANLFLEGSFIMPGSSQPMTLQIGRSRSLQNGKTSVIGLVVSAFTSGSRQCEAQCKVIKFERFAKDLQPALLEMDCEGSRVKTLRMPLHIQWTRLASNHGFNAEIRLGSSLFGMEQTPINLLLNRYAMVASQPKAMAQSPEVSGIHKKQQ